MAECGDLCIVVDMALADKIFVVDRECHVASDARQAADWWAFGLRSFALSQYDPLSIAFLVEERVNLLFF